jgi:hypothetical protein
MKCRAILRAILATKYGFVQIGKTNRDSFSDRELQALNISITTNIDNDIVVARCAGAPVKILQSRCEKADEH